MGRSSKQITIQGSTISENTQKRIKDYNFRTTTSQSKNVEPVLKSWDLFQKNKAKRAKDDGNAYEKEDDCLRENNMAIESNMSPQRR